VCASILIEGVTQFAKRKKGHGTYVENSREEKKTAIDMKSPVGIVGHINITTLKHSPHQERWWREKRGGLWTGRWPMPASLSNAIRCPLTSRVWAGTGTPVLWLQTSK
jgi:hypothetical protein